MATKQGMIKIIIVPNLEHLIIRKSNIMNIENKILSIFQDQLDLNDNPLLTDHLYNDLHMDSLDSIECLMSVEEAFDMEIPDKDVERVRTIQDMVDYVKLNK